MRYLAHFLRSSLLSKHMPQPEEATTVEAKIILEVFNGIL